MTLMCTLKTLKYGFVKGEILTILLRNRLKRPLFFYFFFIFFFLHTLFQFGLIIAPIQDTGLINAKYNNTLYGTIIIWYNK